MFMSLSVGLSEKREDLEDREFECFIMEGEIEELKAKAARAVEIYAQALVGLSELSPNLIVAIGRADEHTYSESGEKQPGDSPGE